MCLTFVLVVCGDLCLFVYIWVDITGTAFFRVEIKHHLNFVVCHYHSFMVLKRFNNLQHVMIVMPFLVAKLLFWVSHSVVHSVSFYIT